jgi:hypothetical protein
MDMLYSQHTLSDKELSAQLEGHHVERIKTRIPPKFPAIVGQMLAVYRHYVPYHKLLRLRYAPFPTQVVVGTEDQLVQMGNSAMLARVLGAKLLVVPNGGHGLFAEHPQHLNEKLLEFFQSAQDPVATEAARRARDAAAMDGSEDAQTSDAEVEAAAQQCVGEDCTGAAVSAAASPYSLEEQALQLACSHSTHCTVHNVIGFLGAFLPAFAFRYVFWSSIALDAASSSADGSPLPRVEQAIRFGLLVGSLRGGWRALRCIVHAFRARRWVLRHGLVADEVATSAAASSSSSSSSNGTDAVSAAALRKGIPRRTGFDFPFHSVAMLGLFSALLWQQKLLHGVFSSQ